MKPRAWLTLLAIAAPALASLSLAGCEADLEVGCVSGDCTGASIGASSHASGVSSGGGGSDTQECLFTETGELPCPVFTILDARCHRCHQDPTKNGAPFALLTWNDFQADYGSRKRWEAAAAAVEPEAFPQMPFGEDPLPEAQLATLREWFDTCRAGDCAKEPLPTGEGGSGGAGGAGAGGIGAGAGGGGVGAGGAG